MASRTVVLGVTGSIAAYKAAELCSRFGKLGYEVYVVMTRAATAFVTPLTFETITGHPVAVELLSRDIPHEIEHISLARRADVFLVAPASANLLGKYANGVADDLLTTTLLATGAPVVIAPAMNTQMYLHAAVQHNMETLRQRGVVFVEPASGRLACGEEGQGRLAEIDDIVSAVQSQLHAKDLDGLRMLVSAGPTHEAIDPVRFLSNHSSGKMGYAIAQAAALRGAQVTLVSGPTHLPPPSGVALIPVTSAREMCEAMVSCFDACDIVIKAAAPADFAPVTQAEHKLKKTDMGEKTAIELERTPDILQQLSMRRAKQRIIGFAAETRDVNSYARDKLQRKGLDMIVANDVTMQGAGFGCDTNIVTFITADGQEALPLMSKRDIAHKILDRALALWQA